MEEVTTADAQSRPVSHWKLNFLLALFVGMIIGMNTLGIKVIGIDFLFFDLSVSVGIFMVPVTFLITDIVSEVYGKKMAKQFLTMGLVVLLVMIGLTSIFVGLEPHERFEINEEYVAVFKGSLRIMIASFVAFLMSQIHDIWAFSFWKRKTGGRFLWLRNNLSTITSQAVDTWIFMFLAFYQVSDRFTFGFVNELALTYFLFKLVLALVDTPLIYAGVAWLKKQ